MVEVRFVMHLVDMGISRVYLYINQTCGTIRNSSEFYCCIILQGFLLWFQ